MRSSPDRADALMIAVDFATGLQHDADANARFAETQRELARAERDVRTEIEFAGQRTTEELWSLPTGNWKDRIDWTPSTGETV